MVDDEWLLLYGCVWQKGMGWDKVSRDPDEGERVGCYWSHPAGTKEAETWLSRIEARVPLKDDNLKSKLARMPWMMAEFDPPD